MSIRGEARHVRAHLSHHQNRDLTTDPGDRVSSRRNASGQTDRRLRGASHSDNQPRQRHPDWVEFTAFRLVPINSPTAFQLLQSVIDRLSLAKLALLHPRELRLPEIEKYAVMILPDFTHDYLNDVISKVLPQFLQAGSAGGFFCVVHVNASDF